MISLLKPKTNPTIDKYFLGPLAQQVSFFPWPTTSRPIVRLGPNTFCCNRRVFVIRYITDQELNKIRQMKPERVFYLLDDDFSCIKNDDSLPRDYRERMQRFAIDYLPQIKALADEVIAPNERVLRAYGDKVCRILHPSYTALCQNFSHFDQVKRINMVFLGSRSHLQDLEFLTPTLVRLCRQYPQLSLTTFLGKHAPAALQGYANIRHRAPMNWARFKTVLHQERFHIAISPLLDTEFNQARSFNKLLDHGAVGAAGVYSIGSPVVSVVQADGDAVLVKNEPSAWFDAIERLILNLKRTEILAKRGALLSQSLGDPQRVADFWRVRYMDSADH